MRVRLTFALVCLATVAGCTRQGVAVLSPDGQHYACVRNHFSFDPPKQSLWLDDKLVARLAEDADWCNQVRWSRDSSTVAFLVQDARIIALRTRDGRLIADRWLVERNGSYPPAKRVCGLTLSDDGRAIRFRQCDRRSSDCSPEQRESLLGD